MDINKKKTTIYVVRHGESTYNVGIENGLKEHEIPLTKKGEGQAKKLAQKLNAVHFDEVLSSDYLRAKKTAEIITLEKQLEIKTIALIRERNFGERYNSDKEHVREEMRAILKKLSEKEKLEYKHTSDMESAKAGGMRLLTFLQEIGRAYTGKTVLVVCHGNIMRTLLNILNWCLFDEIPEGAIENTGYIKLETDGGTFKITETWRVNKKRGIVRIT